MERLTNADHEEMGFVAYAGPKNPYKVPLTIGELAELPNIKYSPREILDEVFARLAAYEDTGLEPDEIELMKEAQEIGENMKPKRLAEILDAEKDSRLVVLPCKVGDILYVPTRGIVSRFECTHIEVREDDDCFWFWIGWRLKHGILGRKRIDGVYASEIGKTVFLTRQEAEEAMREEADNG